MVVHSISTADADTCPRSAVVAAGGPHATRLGAALATPHARAAIAIATPLLAHWRSQWRATRAGRGQCRHLRTRGGGPPPLALPPGVAAGLAAAYNIVLSAPYGHATLLLRACGARIDSCHN